MRKTRVFRKGPCMFIGFVVDGRPGAEMDAHDSQRIKAHQRVLRPYNEIV